MERTDPTIDKGKRPAEEQRVRENVTTDEMVESAVAQETLPEGLKNREHVEHDVDNGLT